MKRLILALLLAVCLTMAFALPVFAQGHSDVGRAIAIVAKASQGAELPDYALDLVPPE